MPHDHTEQGKVQIINLFFANNLANGNNWGVLVSRSIDRIKGNWRDQFLYFG